MKRGKPPQRKSYIKRSTKRIKLRRGDPAKRRWARHRDPDYCAWIREQPCVVGTTEAAAARLNARLSEPAVTAECWLILLGAKECSGPIECAHVQSRATGGADRENVVPCCRTHHRQQHTMGMQSFQRLYSVDLAESARQYTARFLAVAFYV